MPSKPPKPRSLSVSAIFIFVGAIRARKWRLGSCIAELCVLTVASQAPDREALRTLQPLAIRTRADPRRSIATLDSRLPSALLPAQLVERLHRLADRVGFLLVQVLHR